MKKSVILSFVLAATASPVASRTEEIPRVLEANYEKVGDDLKCPEHATSGRMFKNLETETLQECYDRCNSLESCNFFTFFQEKNMCIGCTLDSSDELAEHNGFEAYEITSPKSPSDFGYKLWEGPDGKSGIGHKCPFKKDGKGHPDRIIKHQKTTRDDCYQKCLADDECGWFSWGEDEVSNADWEGNCMLCREDDELQYHEGFNFWTVLKEETKGTDKFDGEDETNDREVDDEERDDRGPGSGSGDPHFKTWTGDKYDYHGECDLVLVDHPTFWDNKGLKVHIRTERVKYFSYISTIAVKIGDDVLEFNNDVNNFLINGKRVEEQKRWVTTYLSGFHVRRDPKAISLRFDEVHKAKIDLIQRKNGFPAVVVDGGTSEIFKGSLGLLGDWETGKRLARDRVTVMNDPDATAFALEWQVRDTEPMLFSAARFPQYPTTCTPPEKQLTNRLGMSRAKEEAEGACAHWKQDKEDCIFDVIATRDISVATEGSIGASVA